VRLLFVQPIITQLGRQRWVVALTVARLADLLRAECTGMAIEHIYDY